MTNQHPIIPPPKLLDKWDNLPLSTQEIFVIAAQWGADQELEACCKVLARELICDGKHVATDLHMIRRPKPPSLKEEALKGFDTIAGIVLDEYSGTTFYEEYKKVTDTIRRALEQLDD
jgi:hypothetical protein